MKAVARTTPFKPQAQDYYQEALNMTCSPEGWKTAERYLRYAACQHHQPARKVLAMGLRHRHFQPEYRHLNRFAIEVLETLVTPDPTQAQIDAIELALRQAVRQIKGSKPLGTTKRHQSLQSSSVVSLSQFMKEAIA